MRLTTREHDEAIILHASGRIAAGHGYGQVREAVQDAVDHGCRTVVLDLHDVRSLDSSGTGELVAAHLRMKSLGGRLILTSLSPKVGNVLLAASLTDLFEIHDDLQTLV